MRKIMILMLCLGLVSMSPGAEAAGKKTRTLAGICSSSLPVESFLIKAEASNHINPGDRRTTGYSLICGRECVQFPAFFFYCDGTPAASFGYYGKWSRSHGGNGMPRAYGAAGGQPQHYVRKIRAIARKKTCGRMLYLQTAAPTVANPIPECRHWDANSSRVGTPY